MRNRMYHDYDSAVCDKCGEEIKVVIINEDLYNICGCGDAIKIGRKNQYWLPDKWV